MKRLFFGICAALMLVAGVTGCNTMQGAGEDIEDAGEGIQDAVN